MKEKEKIIICSGNQTIPYHRGYPIYGAFHMQAITQAQGTCRGGVPYIPEDQVIEAKAFVDGNHK